MVKVCIYQFLLPEIVTVEPQPIGIEAQESKKKKTRPINKSTLH